MARSTADKLGIKPGNTIYVLNSPAPYETMVGPLPDRARVVRGNALPADVVHLFAPNRATLDAKIGEALAAGKPDARVWVSYVKGGGSDINRDTLRYAVEDLGWRPVALIAIDDTWSALRLRSQKEP